MIATQVVASLQVSTQITSGGALQIQPTSYGSDAEVLVSNGATPGGGTVIRAAGIIGSSREIKSDIRYLSEKEEKRAYLDVLALKPVSFRYKIIGTDGTLVEDPSRPLLKGLILEDSPESIRRGRAVMLNEWIELELSYL